MSNYQIDASATIEEVHIKVKEIVSKSLVEDIHHNVTA